MTSDRAAFGIAREYGNISNSEGISSCHGNGCILLVVVAHH